MVIDYGILALYALSMAAIAFYTKNRSKSVNEFLLAGKRGLNGWMSAFSYGTAYFSAVIFIGYAGAFGAKYGLASVWIGVANAVAGGLFCLACACQENQEYDSASFGKDYARVFREKIRKQKD